MAHTDKKRSDAKTYPSVECLILGMKVPLINIKKNKNLNLQKKTKNQTYHDDHQFYSEINIAKSPFVISS